MTRYIVKYSNGLYSKYNGLGFTNDFSQAYIYNSEEIAVNFAESRIDPKYNFEVANCSYEVLPVKFVIC